MQIHQIRYFVALCEERNFTRAARRCGVSQPSLTRAIKLLEKELGGPLFDRAKRRSELSPLGAAVRPYLHQIDQLLLAVSAAAEKAVDVWPASHLELDDRVNDLAQPFALKRDGSHLPVQTKWLEGGKS